MRIYIDFEELMPTTISGHAIKISYVCSSFNKQEIDDLKARLRKEIGSGIISDDISVSQLTMGDLIKIKEVKK